MRLVPPFTFFTVCLFKVSRHLRENPTWPFRETTPHVFQFKVRDPKFWYSICLLFINTGAVLYLYFVAVADRSIIVSVLILLYSLVTDSFNS